MSVIVSQTTLIARHAGAECRHRHVIGPGVRAQHRFVVALQHNTATDHTPFGTVMSRPKMPSRTQNGRRSALRAMKMTPWLVCVPCTITRGDAFLGTTDPRPGRPMEVIIFRNNQCIMRLKSVGPESAFIAAGKVDRRGPPGDHLRGDSRGGGSRF
jgi:hypothetical protein